MGRHSYGEWQALNAPPAGSPPRIFTVGHSNRDLEAFLELLREGEITQLADVRRYPSSRRHPHFNGPVLARGVAPAGVTYRHFEALGGHRQEAEGSPHRAWEEPAFRAYADHMETAEFAAALSDLQAWSREGVTAVMCAEAAPGSCHRQLLADALVRDGWRVVHLTAPGQLADHQLHPTARLDGHRLVYDGGLLPFD